MKTLFEVLQDHSYIPVAPKPTTLLPSEPSKLIIPSAKATNPPAQLTPPKQMPTPKASKFPKQISPPKPSNAVTQSSVASSEINVLEPSNPPQKADLSPQQSNPPFSPKPVNNRLLSTDESLRPQAAEVGLLYFLMYRT